MRAGALYGFCCCRVNRGLLLMSDAIETNFRGEGDLWKGLVAGLIGGLVASWTMNRFQDVCVTLSDHQDGSDQSSKPEHDQSNNEEQDDTTVRTASAISEGLFNHKLTESEKKI